MDKERRKIERDKKKSPKMTTLQEFIENFLKVKMVKVASVRKWWMYEIAGYL